MIKIKKNEKHRERCWLQATEVAHGVVPIGPLRREGLIEHSTKVLEAAMSNYKSQIKPVADEYTSNHLTCRSSMWLQGLLDLVI